MLVAKPRQIPGQFGVGFPSKRDESVINASGHRNDSVVYDFASDTGATAVLDFGRKIPAGAVITSIRADVLTALTSAGSATLQLKAGSTALIAATAYSSITGTASIALASSATAIKIATLSHLTLTIAGAALTAGKVRFYVNYLLPNDGRH